MRKLSSIYQRKEKKLTLQSWIPMVEFQLEPPPCYFAAPLEQVLSLFPLSGFYLIKSCFHVYFKSKHSTKHRHRVCVSQCPTPICIGVWLTCIRTTYFEKIWQILKKSNKYSQKNKSFFILYIMSHKISIKRSYHVYIIIQIGVKKIIILFTLTLLIHFLEKSHTNYINVIKRKSENILNF